MSKIINIDINADVGEGLDNEHQLMPYLSSCNIACGGHAGDEITMRKVLKLAGKHKVRAGAHPSLPDRKNFGRLHMDISQDELYSSLISQVQNLKRIAEQENIELSHLKPHGALYNLAASDRATAEVIVNVIQDFGNNLKLYAPYQSVIANFAKDKGIDVCIEGFADRNYTKDGALVSRSESNALISDRKKVLSHVLRMLIHEQIMTIDGFLIPIRFQTLCVHGDTQNALQIVQYLHSELPKNKIKIL